MRSEETIGEARYHLDRNEGWTKKHRADLRETLIAYFNNFAGRGSDPQAAPIAILAAVGLALLDFADTMGMDVEEAVSANLARYGDAELAASLSQLSFGPNRLLKDLNLPPRAVTACRYRKVHTTNAFFRAFLTGEVDSFRVMGQKSLQDCIDALRERGYSDVIDAMLPIRELLWLHNSKYRVGHRVE